MKTPTPAGFWLFLFLCTALSLRAQEHDHIVLDLEFEDSLLHVQATYYTGMDTPGDSLWFILNPEIRVGSLSAPGLASYELVPKQGRPFPFRLLKFEQMIPANQPLEIHFSYSIDLTAQNHMRSGWIELTTDKLWFPNRKDIDNRFTWEVNIKNFPLGYSLYSYSDANLIRQGDRVTLKSTEPRYEVLLLAGENMTNRTYDSGMTISAHAKTPDSVVNSIGKKVREIIGFLNTCHGGSDPIKDFRVILRNTSRDEIGYQFNRGNLIITGTDFNDYGNLSHEIAHFWWNKAAFIKEPWINESFANYSMFKVLEQFDQNTYERLLEKTRKIADEAIPVSEATLFTENAFNSYYHKGALHLLALEGKIGKQAMQQLLTTCVDNEVSTTEGFLKELEKMAGSDQRIYFEELLDR